MREGCASGAFSRWKETASDDRSAAGDSRQKQHRGGLAELGVEPCEQANVLAVDEHVEEARDTVSGEDAVLERGVLGDKRTECSSDGPRIHGDRPVPRRFGAEDRRYADLRHDFKR